MTDPKTDAAPKPEAAGSEADATAEHARAPHLGSTEPPPLRAPAPMTAPTESAPAARGRSGWATFAALVALGAAGVSIAGPSLRPHLAEQLTARFGPHELIGILTGTAAPKPKDAVRIDLAAFDQRVAALAQALGQPGGTTVDPATLAALTQALGRPLPTEPSPESRRITELTERLAALGNRVDALDRSAGEAAAVAEKAQAELVSRLGAAEQAAAAQTQRMDAVEHTVRAADLAALRERLGAAERRIAEMEERATQMAARNGAAAMLTLLSRVRLAVEMSDPFVEEVKALATLAGGDADARSAVEALAMVAAQGVPNMPRLQRTLAPLLAGIVESERAATATWYTRAASLLTWSEPASPHAEAIGDKVDGIARDLRNGQLSSAVWKLRALDVPLGEGVHAWIAEANRRMTADQALRVLTELAFRRTQG